MDRAPRQALRVRRGPSPVLASAPNPPADLQEEALATPGFEAHHQPDARLLSAGGPILAAPRIVPIFYPGDAKMGALVDFTTRLLTSKYWKQTTSEYGVGPGSVAPTVIRSEAPPATIFDVDIAAWLRAKLEAHDPSLPAPDANTLYALFFPTGTVVEFAPYYPGQTPAMSCKNFGAYHDNITLSTGQDVAFSVMPRCDQGYRSYTPEEQLTLAPGHEFAEAATDPYPETTQGYALLDFNGSTDSTFEGAEVGDMCEFIPVSVAASSDVGYPVQRLWSNRAAAAGHDPCLPALGPVYFNAAPVVGGTEVWSGYYARGLTLAAGATATIDVQLFSDAPTQPWTVSAKEVDTSGALTFSFDRTQGKNGDTLHLTITRSADPYTYPRAEIDSTLDGRTNIWPLVIGY